MLAAVEQPALRVSVVIPTYNRAGYLREALASVFAQTLPPWEVIIVDDGSTDNTEQVIRDAARSVKFCQQAHKGVAEARNLGLENASGDLIAWLDSDDLWEPDFLAAIVPLLAQDASLDGVYTGITLIDTKGVRLREATRVEPPDMLYAALIRNNFLATPSIVARKACYDQAGGFDSQLRIAEDYDMWLRLARRHRVVGLPRPLVRIRVHASNTISDVDTFCQARLILVEKHFGALTGDSSTLSDASKVAYGYAYRAITTKYIESGQPTKGWPYLERAVALHPAILAQLDTFYELALGDQPRGYRGEATQEDIAANGAEMLRRMDILFASSSPPVQVLKGAAYGNAYLALAMLSEQAGDWSAARRYLIRAIRFHPRLLRDQLVMRRLFKLLLGQRLAGGLRRLSLGSISNKTA